MERVVALMLLKGNQTRALKGFIYGKIIDSRVLYIITAAIVFGYIFVSAIIDTILVSASQASNHIGGALTNGFGMVAIIMLIFGIIMTTRKEARSVFVFPIDRKTYTIGTFIIITLNTIVLLMIAAIGFLLEFIIYQILTRIFDNIIYINVVNLETFLAGFWISLCYIMFFTTLIFSLFTLFARYKFPAVITFALVIGLPFITSFGRTAFYRILMFYAGEQSLILLSLKLLVLAVVFQLLSYLSFRKMEVIK
jgi:hypothetical protein